jgi:hypothetical protein
MLPWTFGILAAACLWLANFYFNQSFISSLGLIFIAAVGAGGLLYELNSLLILAAVVLGLAAWDIDLFRIRLKKADKVEGNPQRAHLPRVFLTCTIAFALGLIGLNLRLELGFGWAMLIGIITLLGIAAILRLGAKLTEGS